METAIGGTAGPPMTSAGWTCFDILCHVIVITVGLVLICSYGCFSNRYDADALWLKLLIC